MLRTYFRRLARSLHALMVLLVGLGACGASAGDRPNVVLFIADDVSWNDYGCYGNEHARTPNIDALAANGLQFQNAILTASSCSPSRASIVTGRYPHNNGKAAELHLPIAANLPWFPELLRNSGYYTALCGKNHMKVDKTIGVGLSEPRAKAFDLIDSSRAKGNSGGHSKWLETTRNRPKDKPFFFWFAAFDAHRGWDADREWDANAYGPLHQPNQVAVPPFLRDTGSTRQDLASYYNEVTRFDFFIGQVVEELQRQQVLENTLILILADNGRPFPRATTRLHDSGMKTALIAHWPKGFRESGELKQLVSVIDLAPTILSIAGLPVADSMQGVSMEPMFQSVSAGIREYAFSEHNWHDYEAHGRSIRDGRFLYIRNNRPYQMWQGPADSVRSPSHVDLLQARAEADLTDAQGDVFLNPRPAEELYLVAEDPHQLTNLAGDESYAADLARLRRLLEQWSMETADSIPKALSADSFDRDSGERIVKGESYRGQTPGEDRKAWRVNAPGPR
ncbi:MAG: sulfatase [Planctomycetota bacterium]